MGKENKPGVKAAIKEALRYKKDGFQLVEGKPETMLYREDLNEIQNLYKRKAKKEKKVVVTAEPIKRPRGSRNGAGMMAFDYVPMLEKYLGDTLSLKAINHLANLLYIAEYNDEEVKELCETMTSLKEG